MSDETRMTNVEWATERQLSSPNGAKYDSPGHRPGAPGSNMFSPEGAAHLPEANPPDRTPLQGSGSVASLVLGRCPRLAWTGPLALKMWNSQTEWAAGQLIRLAESSPDAEAGLPDSPARDQMRNALASLTGIWKDRGTTADLMNLTRGED